MLSVLRALTLDRVPIRVCPVTLHDFLVRTNDLHTCFSPEELMMDHITCFGPPNH